MIIQVQINTNASGNFYGPILHLNGLSGDNGTMWGLLRSGAPEAAEIGAAGNSTICNTQAVSRLVINAAGYVGIGITNSRSYFHGGNIRVLEIFNPDTTVNSQSHLILSRASLATNSSAGSISWMSKGSAGTPGLAYIAAFAKGDGTNNASGDMVFATADSNLPVERLRISIKGNLLIGQPTQANQNYKIDVAGSLRAKEIIVNGTGADFVFDKSYHLSFLAKVDQFMIENHHQPGIKSADEMTSEVWISAN
jgi:hypothetical protein